MDVGLLVGTGVGRDVVQVRMKQYLFVSWELQNNASPGKHVISRTHPTSSSWDWANTRRVCQQTTTPQATMSAADPVYARLSTYDVLEDAVLRASDARAAREDVLTHSLMDFGLFRKYNNYRETLGDKPSEVQVLPSGVWRDFKLSVGAYAPAATTTPLLSNRFIIVPIWYQPPEDPPGSGITPCPLWFVAVLVNIGALARREPGAPLPDLSDEPCIILFDSCRGPDRSRVHRPELQLELQKFVGELIVTPDWKLWATFCSRFYYPKVRSLLRPTCISLTTPAQLPGHRSDADSGIYALHYVGVFLSDPQAYAGWATVSRPLPASALS